MRDVSTLRAKVYYLGVDLMQKEEASRTTSAASTASVGVHFAEWAALFLSPIPKL